MFSPSTTLPPWPHIYQLAPIFRCLFLVNPHNKRHPCSYHFKNSKGFRNSAGNGTEICSSYYIFIIIINHNVISLHIPIFLFVSPVHSKSHSIQSVPNTYGLTFCELYNHPSWLFRHLFPNTTEMWSSLDGWAWVCGCVTPLFEQLGSYRTAFFMFSNEIIPSCDLWQC